MNVRRGLSTFAWLGFIALLVVCAFIPSEVEQQSVVLADPVFLERFSGTRATSSPAPTSAKGSQSIRVIIVDHSDSSHLHYGASPRTVVRLDAFAPVSPSLWIWPSWDVLGTAKRPSNTSFMDATLFENPQLLLLPRKVPTVLHVDESYFGVSSSSSSSSPFPIALVKELNHALATNPVLKGKDETQLRRIIADAWKQCWYPDLERIACQNTSYLSPFYNLVSFHPNAAHALIAEGFCGIGNHMKLCGSDDDHGLNNVTDSSSITRGVSTLPSEINRRLAFFQAVLSRVMVSPPPRVVVLSRRRSRRLRAWHQVESGVLSILSHIYGGGVEVSYDSRLSGGPLGGDDFYG